MVGGDLAASADEGKRPVELTEELIGSRLDTMPELPRTVFLLRHLDGLDDAAIGAQLGIAIGDVERHLADAMHVLVWGDG